MSVKHLREKAWKKLLSQNPTNEDLHNIIKNVDSLREKAMPLLKKTKEDIIREMKYL